MSCKLVITHYQDGIISILYDENQKPVEMHYSGASSPSLAGNIYVGRVRDVVKSIKGAFLDLGENLKAYYPIDDKAAPFYTKKGSSVNIQQGDELLVQIKKDAVKTKDPAVTSEISINSVYFVAFLNAPGIHYSGKMSAEDKKRISMIVEETDLHDFGLIVRTNAATATESELKEDLTRVLTRLNDIRKKAPFRPGASLIYQSPAQYLNVIKNTNQVLLDEIITDDAALYREIAEYLKTELPALSDHLRFYQDKLLPLYKLYCVESAVEEAFQMKVWMKSGAYLVIQETEALTVIDVNSGKITSKKSQEETFLKINLEAARESARQLRLRNISGIIIVDFINMKSKENEELLLKEFQKELMKDPVKANVIDMTPLGLVEVTRQRQKGTIREQMR